MKPKREQFSVGYSFNFKLKIAHNIGSHSERTRQGEGREGLSGSCHVSCVMLYSFFHDPRNKNLSSVILISAVLFISSLHPFLIFYFLLSFHSPPPLSCPLHPPSLTPPQLFPPLHPLPSLSLHSSLSLSPVLIVYIH